MKFASTLALLGATASLASAFVRPSEPIGSSVWTPGTNVTITWTDDNVKPLLSTNPVFDIYLMTGGDQTQQQLAVIAEKVKGAAPGGSFVYTVPYVDPPGKIYFLMFKEIRDDATPPGMAWATRFHITDANGVKSSLEPTGPPNGITGAIGSIVAAPTTAAPTPTDNAKDPKATAAGTPPSGASALKMSSAAAAVAGFVGAAAMALF